MGKRRPNGDGLVRKREDGRWEARIIVGHKENGNPIYRSVFAEKQGELMPKLAELKEQYAGVELTEDSSITLGEWLDRWMEEYKKPLLRPSTYTGYSTDIRNHLLPHLGSKKLTQLKTSDLQKLYNRLLESGRMKDNGKGNGLAPATVRGIHVIICPTFACTTCVIRLLPMPRIRVLLPKPCPKSLDTVRRASRWTTMRT